MALAQGRRPRGQVRDRRERFCSSSSYRRCGRSRQAKSRPRLLVSLGIITLLLTPYVRVLASFVLFAFVERNAKYAVFTGFVLAVLSYSLFLR